MNEKSPHIHVYILRSRQASLGLDASICNPFKLSSLGISAHLDLLYGFHLGTERDAARRSRQNLAVRGSAFPGARSRSSAQSICRSAAETRAAFDFGLEDRTPVPLKLARELSSAKEAAGSRVDFEVVEGVKVHSLVVIPKGEMAWGTIVDAKPKRRLGRAGKLDVRIDE